MKNKFGHDCCSLIKTQPSKQRTAKTQPNWFKPDNTDRCSARPWVSTPTLCAAPLKVRSIAFTQADLFYPLKGMTSPG